MMVELTCTWSQDEDGVWNTSCLKAFGFYQSGPERNGFKFCPYCSKPIDENPYAMVIDIEDIPMLAIGADQILDEPVEYAVECPHCGHVHQVLTTEDEAFQGATLQYYKCGEYSYLCGINGKRIEW